MIRSALTTLMSIFCIFASSALAKPRYIRFTDMVNQTAHIVVASVEKPDTDGKATLRVYESLRGSLEPGLVEVNCPQRVAVPKDKKLLAFVDGMKNWEFAATPLTGEDLNLGLLKLFGFYNFNAYLVDPGFMTRRQLETYLDSGVLVMQYRGSLWFPGKGDASWQASSLEMNLTYDALNKSLDAGSLTKELGLTEPLVLDQRPWDPDVTLQVGRSRLVIKGLLDRVDPATGEILLKFYVERPVFLNLRDLVTYASDKRQARPWFDARIACAPAEGVDLPETLLLDDRDGNLAIRKFRGKNAKVRVIQPGAEKWTAIFQYDENSSLRLTLTIPPRPKSTVVVNPDRSLIYELLRCPLKGTLTQEEPGDAPAKILGNVTVTFGSQHFEMK